MPTSEQLFTDPYAQLFFDDEANSEAGQMFDQLPFFRPHIRVRTRYIDDTVRRALADGVRDIVLPGAGFDTRALRLPEVAASGARVVEIDHAEQLDEKRRRLTAAGVALPSHVVQAPADLAVAGELERALDAAGVRAGTRILWVCEGLLGYLSPDAVVDLAERTGLRSGAGSSFIGNHSIYSHSVAALTEAFARSGWRGHAGPNCEELYRALIGPEPPPGGEVYAFFEAER